MKQKHSVAIVRGTFLNKYEMQFFEPLASKYKLHGFGSWTSYHTQFSFPVTRLPSPMDIPNFPYKMALLNRLFIDAHYLLGLENKLKGYDVVHTAETYFHYTQQCLNAKRRGYVKKVIATVLENIPFNNEGIWGRKAFKARARNELDHIIALTEKTKDALILEGADEEKITVISHFIDTKKFTPVKRFPESAAGGTSNVPATFDSGATRFRESLNILFCGRLEVYKGVYDFIDAAARLLKDKDLKKFQLTFVLVGDGDQRGNLIAKEKELGIENHVVHKHVSYDDMPGLYQNADIFVAPSKPTKTYDEQYCTVLLEAQASALPIVTTKTGGIPENIGNAGILVEPGDVLALAQGIKSFIVSPEKRFVFAKKARNRAVTVHDIQIGAKKLHELYQRVLSK